MFTDLFRGAQTTREEPTAGRYVCVCVWFSSTALLQRCTHCCVKIRAAVCVLGILLGEIVKNLSKMAVPDPKHTLKLMMLSAVRI